MIASLAFLWLTFAVMASIAVWLLKGGVLGAGLLLAAFSGVGLILLSREWCRLMKTLSRRRRARAQGRRRTARLVAVEPRWGRPPVCRWVAELDHEDRVVRLEDEFMAAPDGFEPGQTVEVDWSDDGEFAFRT